MSTVREIIEGASSLGEARERKLPDFKGEMANLNRQMKRAADLGAFFEGQGEMGYQEVVNDLWQVFEDTMMLLARYQSDQQAYKSGVRKRLTITPAKMKTALDKAERAASELPHYERIMRG